MTRVHSQGCKGLVPVVVRFEGHLLDVSREIQRPHLCLFLVLRSRLE